MTTAPRQDVDVAADAPPVDPDEVMHATCCRPDYFLSDRPVYAMCGKDCSAERILLELPEGATVCEACEALVRGAFLTEPADCSRVCPRLLFGS